MIGIATITRSPPHTLYGQGPHHRTGRFRISTYGRPCARPDHSVYFVKSVFWFWSCSFFGFGHWGMLVVVDWLLVWSNMRASLMRR
ncbi:hypothetical protein LF915_00755, partial [Bifidobacterium pseudolongum]|uniref:hypothetical protein n=1 Tax=Bifidobacterium pseudolongum TaxID=1694 RepID=UPI001F104BD3